MFLLPELSVNSSTSLIPTIWYFMKDLDVNPSHSNSMLGHSNRIPLAKVSKVELYHVGYLKNKEI